MQTKSTFLARNALMPVALAHDSPDCEGSVLPMPARGGNFSLNKPVTRWMLGYMNGTHWHCRTR